MSNPSRPMPAWLKWLCRMLGLLLILGAAARGYFYAPVVQATVKALRGGEKFNIHTHGLVAAQVLGMLAGLILGVWLWRRAAKGKAAAAQPPPADVAVPATLHHPAQLTPAKRWSSCNVLQIVGESRRIWQFDGSKFTLNRELALANGQPLPSNLIGKSFSSIWNPQLNIACLPPDAVFFRPVQLPQAGLEETRAMVEFQLEKISPLPVTQIAWGMLVLPTPSRPAAETQSEQLQTVVVIIVADSLVEEHLGQLEREGFLADRLEVPLLDQLAKSGGDDGVWVYLNEAQPAAALAAWWQDGVLHNLGLVSLPMDKNQTGVLREQLEQMSWAGEIEGWLTKVPAWHLVADSRLAAEWQPVFGKALGEPIKVAAPLPAVELVASTARRAAKANDAANLVPQEYTARYRQQFVDRLWLRGLISVGVLYLVGVFIYLIALGFLEYQTRGVEKQVAEQTDNYKKALQLRARYQIMKERQDLKFAALDCWKLVAELLPQGAALESLDFKDGFRLALRGNAAAEQKVALNDFNAAMRKATIPGTTLLMFKQVESLIYTTGPNNTVTWNFSCELSRREEAEP